MAVKASATITLTQYRDTQSVTRYYKLQTAGSSAPSKPETKPPSSDWTDSEPACDISKELYFCDLTIFSNGEGEYSKVSKSTSYEAAKQAYNRAQSAKDSIDNLEIGGRNLLPDTDFGGASKKHIVPDGVVEGSGGEGGFQFTPTTQIESGIEYTLSLRMRGYANVSFYELNTGGNISHRIARRSDLSETDYKKISYTFVVRADRTFQQVYICTAWGSSAAGDWFEIEPKSLKLEKGNRATDWTPAPEDVDAGIDNAAKVATNYMEYDSTNGLIVGNKTGGSFVGSRAQVLPDSFNILNTDGTKRASFGETTIIGDTNKANLYLTYNELYMEDKDDKVFFKVGDYRGSTGVATLTYTDTRSVNVSAGRVYVALSIPAKIESVISVVVEGTTISEGNYRFSIIDETLNGEVVDHTTSMWVEGLTYGEGDKVEVEVTYTTKSPYSYYVFGLPDKSLIPGRFSSSEGWCTRASGEYTHAEGRRSLASGYASHAEGSSYAYGYMSHAEGISTANGTYSHAEGNSTTGKNANFSHAEGNNTVASSESQHVSGAFNIIDNDGKYAFIIGNGSGLNSRSNAMTVDWNGVPTFYGMAGEIKMWAGDTIPTGWLLCDGSEVSKTDYPYLYEAIRDLWGTPNSSSNFKLPNLTGRVPVGYNSADTDFAPVGHTDGEKKHKLTIAEMPSHNHSRNYYNSNWCSNGSKSGYHGNDGGSKRSTGSTGGNGAHNNLQPYAVVKYIICAI